MVSNHISWIDLFVDRSYSFLGSIKTKKLPFCDGIGKKGRSIFIDRKNNESREKATK